MDDDAKLRTENPIVVLTVEAASPEEFAQIRRRCEETLQAIEGVHVKAFSWLVEPPPDVRFSRPVY